MLEFFDMYLLEAVISGLLFGIIDVVWICYAEMIMLGTYAMYYLFTVYHPPFLLAALISIGVIGILGVILHVVVIQPLLDTVPTNQLLATGRVLFFMLSAATGVVGIDFHNLGARRPCAPSRRNATLCR